MADIISYIRAGYSLLYLHTSEETRAEQCILNAVKELKGRALKVWSHSEGLSFPLLPKIPTDKEAVDPVMPLTKIGKDASDCIYIFRDLHKFFQIPKVLRLLRDHARDFKQVKKTLIIIAPVNLIPPDLERDVALIDFDLPGRPELTEVLNMMCKQNNKIMSQFDADEMDLIIDAALGLTCVEAENAMAKAIVDWSFSPIQGRLAISALVMREKANVVKKTGMLEYFQAAETANDIGGLGNLKQWLRMRKKAFSKAARDYYLPLPKGIVLVGLPGCGKSLTAKAASNILGVPLIRFDIGKIFAGLIGQSEQNMRNALQTIDAIGNSVVWIDEMEKAFAGMGGDGRQDSGVSRRVFGSLITWMSEKKGGSFIVATVNGIDSLPDELLRKGRFDEIFFVGLPTEAEREEIFKIQLKKIHRDPNKFDCKALAQDKCSKGFSGAEIEQAIISAMYASFDLERELTTDSIQEESESAVPLSKCRTAQLNEMVKWANQNAVKASFSGSSDDSNDGRSLDVNSLKRSIPNGI